MEYGRAWAKANKNGTVVYLILGFANDSICSKAHTVGCGGPEVLRCILGQFAGAPG